MSWQAKDLSIETHPADTIFDVKPPVFHRLLTRLSPECPPYAPPGAYQNTPRCGRFWRGVLAIAIAIIDSASSSCCSSATVVRLQAQAVIGHSRRLKIAAFRAEFRSFFEKTSGI
jgi:hypothetical protein